MMTMLSPYPGLRPFQVEEHDLFFGREEQVDELLRRLRDNRFLAVVGPSGCGKSSLVRAGMMAALETGYLVTAGSEWRFAAMRPGRQPMRRLAEALIARARLFEIDLDAGLARDLIKDTLARGPRGLAEVLDGAPMPAGTNLLVLVDQFEEIFRFRREGDLDEANAFVALLLESAAQQVYPIYVVITMRSDFFGDCAVFTGLPEVINKSQYLTPRLTREQREAAIVGPARVFGGDVEPSLLNRLLNDMGTDPDQLPVLQHLLMRMWTWRGDAVAPHPEHSPVAEGKTLTLTDYESVGGFANALSNHAEEAFATLREGQQRVAEILLRRLSERGADNRAIRRPTSAGEVAALAEVTVEDVTQVADAFRAPDCSFLVPASPEPVYARTVLDISHESFLRQWQRLKGWIDAEAKSAESYRFLEQSARHWKQGRAALWGTPNLELALAWREEVRPTAEWAGRYGGDFALAMEFLTASEKAQRADLARKETRRKASVRRLRRLVVGLAALLLLVVGGIGYYLYDRVLEHTAYFNTFIKKRGIAEGYGPLTGEQRKARLISLKVVRKGRSGEVKFIEAVNASGRCDPRHGIGTVLPFNEPVSPSHKECRWEFVRDARGDIAYELAFNQFGNFVWGLAYTPKTADLFEGRRRAHFLDAHGRVAALKNSRAEMVEVTYSLEGYEILYAYLDRDGQPQPGRDLAYKLRQPANEKGLAAALISLDQNDQLMNDYIGNAEFRMVYDALGNMIRGEAFDRHGNKVTMTTGYQREENIYDAAGNLTETRFYNARGGPALEKQSGAHRIVRKYTAGGNLTSEEYYGTSNEKTTHEEFKYHKKASADFDHNGNWLSIHYYDTHDDGSIDNNGCHAYSNGYNDYGQLVESRCYDLRYLPAQDQSGAHLERVEYDVSGNNIAHSYFDVNDFKVENKAGYHRLEIKRDKRGNIVERTHFDADGRPVETSYGYHRQLDHYDLFGYRTATRFFGTDGMPVLVSSGYHRVNVTYNSRGHQTEFAYFGIDDEPIKFNGEYHRLKIENDEQGRPIQEAYYDEAYNLVALPSGYAMKIRQYDDRGNPVEERLFGPQRQLIHVKETCSIWRGRYDDQGRLVSSECFDGNDRPATFAAGYAKWTAKYDANGNLVEETRTGIDGRLFAPDDSYARYTAAFDESNRLVEETYYGADGQLRMQPKRGYARKTARYEHHQQTETAFYDQEGKLKLQDIGWAKAIARYDRRGNQTEVEFLAEDGRLRLQSIGYAKVVKAFDKNNNELEVAYFGEDGQLRVQDGGYARFTQLYDDQNRLIEQAYYDAHNNPAHPINGNQCAHKVRKIYRADGGLYSERFSGFGPHWGYDEMLVSYNEKGEAVGASYMDGGGQPVETEVHVASVISGTPAESMGIQAGDIILEYNDRPVSDVISFIRKREAEAVDVPTGKLRVRRGADILTFRTAHGKIGMNLRDKARVAKAPAGCTETVIG